MATGRTLRTLLQPEVQVRARSVQGRNQSDPEPDKRRNPKREGKDTAVHANRTCAGESGRAKRYQRAYAELRYDHSESAAHHRKHKTLCEQLANHPHSP